MRKLTVIAIALVMFASATCFSFAGTSDKALAEHWRDAHCPKAKIEKVITVSKGGYKGKAGKYSVKYPRKVAKGKKVVVYMVVKGGDVKAMVCLGKVK